MPDTLPAVALALRRLRTDAAMTQAALAVAAGVNRTMIAHIESGAKTPSLDAAGRLADALGVTLDQLTGRE